MTRSTEHNILRAIPFLLVFLLLGLMGWAGYRAYKSVQPKPKPAEIVTTACSDPAGCNTGTVWLRCNAGCEHEGEGVDRLHSAVGLDLARAWSQRPRKHRRKATPGHLWLAMAGQSPSTIRDYNPHQHVTLHQLENLGQGCILMINGGCWVRLDPPHWQEGDVIDEGGSADGMGYGHLRDGDYIGTFTPVSTRYDYKWTFVNTLPTMIHCSKLTGIMHGECVSRPLTPEEIGRYKPMAEKPTADCHQFSKEDGGQCLPYTTIYPPAGADSFGSWVKPATKPSDITNLMEKIAPTSKREP